MTAALRVLLSTPSGEETLEGVLQVRFEAPDGMVGVLPGHEPARAVLLPGVVRLLVATGPASEGQRLLACEGGVIQIGPREVVLHTRWLEEGHDLDRLVDAVRLRQERRRALELEARAQVERHEAATRRALAALQREVQR